jgi:RHS repeat-associated protein
MPLIVQDGTTSYITGPGGLPLEQVSSTGTVLYYYQDQLGSTRALLDGSGNTEATYTYDAYGNVKSSTGSVSNPFQYAGQYTDSESGLQYLRARYYDPSTEQFLTVDPAVAVTGEPYSYAEGDSVNGADPSGLWFGADDAGAILGGAASGAAYSIATQLIGNGSVDLGQVAIAAVAGGAAGEAELYGGPMAAGAVYGLVSDAGSQLYENGGACGFNGGELAASTLLGAALGIGSTQRADASLSFIDGKGAGLPRKLPNWSSRRADNDKGWVYQAPGPHVHKDANSFRVMDPTDMYPNGYVRFYNQIGQPIDVNGKPTGRAETHFPRDWAGPWPPGPWHGH